MNIGQNGKRTFSESDYDDFEHTGPGTLMGLWLRRFWHPLFLSRDLAPNRPRPVKLLGEEFMLFRNGDGKVFVTEPRCPHRKTLLHLGWIEDNKITCRYHGWQYAAETGECVRQPFEKQPFCETVKLRTYPVREYLGLIFAYLGEGEPPAFDRYLRLESPNVHLETSVAYSDFNYLNNRENDPLHTPFVHATLGGAGFEISAGPATVRARETGWGFAADVETHDGIRETIQYGMPTINIIPGGGGIGADADLGVTTEHFGWKLPIDDEHGVHFLIFASHVPEGKMDVYLERRARKKKEQEQRWAEKRRPSVKEMAEAVFSGKVRIEDIGPDDVDPPGLGVILLQDWIILAGQGVIHTERNKERLGSSDAQVVLNRRLLRRELRALAEGQPLKQWRYDDRENISTWESPSGRATTELKTIKREVKTA